ncbi:glutamine-hydrolyzing GMP synthase [candidate division KSB1 bacterium]
MAEEKREKILVLDFGGQYTQLISKSVRKCQVFSEIKDCNYNIGKIIRGYEEGFLKGLILSGGPDSCFEKGAPYINEYLLELGIPILGICYGMQHMNHLLGGGIIQKGEEIDGKIVSGEYWQTNVNINNTHPLFNGLDERIIALMSHGDSVDPRNLAEGFEAIAHTEDHIAAMANDERKLYGVQFHPEVTHTPRGLDIISNFVHDICGAGHEWTMGNFIEECKQYIRETVGNNNVISFVSGGVDSSFVTTVLAQTEGIGRVIPVYIGALMRKGENEEVIKSLEKAGVKDLLYYELESEFMEVVDGMSEPEPKRKAIGNFFGAVMQKICEELGLDPAETYLGQGTLYTDTIESGVFKKAAPIKSHHNVGCPFIEEMKKRKKIVEPNRLIFKDEVRGAAREIGLPPEISERQPYPGPGLAIRIVDGNPAWVDDHFYAVSDDVSRIAKEEGFEGYIVPIKTVGVQGDDRTYSFLALLRGERDSEKMNRATLRIPKEVHDVNRVVFDIGQGEIDRKYLTDLIPTQVNRETIDLLKDADYEGRKIIDGYGFSPDISQSIFVLFAADINQTGKRSVAGRFVSTDDFMTVSAVEPKHVKRNELVEYRKNNMIRMSWECLQEIRDTLLKMYDIGAFVYDITGKPPATTCWE